MYDYLVEAVFNLNPGESIPIVIPPTTHFGTARSRVFSLFQGHPQRDQIKIECKPAIGQIVIMRKELKMQIGAVRSRQVTREAKFSTPLPSPFSSSPFSSPRTPADLDRECYHHAMNQAPEIIHSQLAPFLSQPYDAVLPMLGLPVIAPELLHVLFLYLYVTQPWKEITRSISSNETVLPSEDFPDLLDFTEEEEEEPLVKQLPNSSSPSEEDSSF